MLTVLAGGWLVWMLFLFFGCALLASAVADSKGKSGFLWFILGFVFNIFALIAIAGMPSLLNRPTPKTHIRCPECREFVFMDAKKCKHCHTVLIPTLSPPSGAEKLGKAIGGLFDSKKNT